MLYKHFNESQSLLNRNLFGLRVAFYFFIYLVIFCPLWFTGFMIEQKIFDHKYKGIKEVLIIAGFAVLIYWLLFLLKGILLFCKGKGNLLWIPLYLLCTGFAAVAPAIELFLITRHSLQPVMGVIASIALFALTYSHYQFHADRSSGLGRPAYHLGIDIASKL